MFEDFLREAVLCPVYLLSPFIQSGRQSIEPSTSWMQGVAAGCIRLVRAQLQVTFQMVLSNADLLRYSAVSLRWSYTQLNASLSHAGVR